VSVGQLESLWKIEGVEGIDRRGDAGLKECSNLPRVSLLSAGVRWRKQRSYDKISQRPGSDTRSYKVKNRGRGV